MRNIDFVKDFIVQSGKYCEELSKYSQLSDSTNIKTILKKNLVDADTINGISKFITSIGIPSSDFKKIKLNSDTKKKIRNLSDNELESYLISNYNFTLQLSNQNISFTEIDKDFYQNLVLFTSSIGELSNMLSNHIDKYLSIIVKNYKDEELTDTKVYINAKKQIEYINKIIKKKKITPLLNALDGFFLTLQNFIL